MTYDDVMQNACSQLRNVGVEFHIDDTPRMLQEVDICDSFRIYVGEEEAEELQRQLILHDIRSMHA